MEADQFVLLPNNQIRSFDYYKRNRLVCFINKTSLAFHILILIIYLNNEFKIVNQRE